MEISEQNDLSTDNLACDSLEVDNLATSDEISPHFDYVKDGKTDYAKSKAPVKAVTAVTLMTAGAAAGGSFLPNSFLGDLPELTKEPSLVYHVKEESIYYTLSVKNEGKLNCKLLILEREGKEEVYSSDITKTGDYSGDFKVQKNTSYLLKVNVTNSFDYEKNIYKLDLIYPFTDYTEKEEEKTDSKSVYQMKNVLIVKENRDD